MFAAAVETKNKLLI